MNTNALAPSRLGPADVLRLGSLGLRSRKARSALSALGVAIGITSLVAVLGISASSQANLLAQLDKLGTNLLQVQPGQSFLSSTVNLPTYSVSKVRSMAHVYAASGVYAVPNVTVRRTQYVSSQVTGGITVQAADDSLPRTLSGGMAAGQFLSAANDRFPVVVLGAAAAQLLGIDNVTGQQQVYLSGRWFTVIGILKPLPLASSVDQAVLMGLPAAQSLYHLNAYPSTIYLRADTDHVNAVYSLLAATTYPEHPEEVQLSRPSDALQARADAKGAFTSLFLGLGAVALIVGAVGIANVMVISVLERRSEIGLRRALGSTRRQIASQFITESLLLALLGGVAGVIIGVLVTSGYAAADGLPTSVPAAGIFGGLAAALVTGVIAGLYPAARAARLAPTEALRTA